MRILLADDDPQILRALRITLTARGYDVVTAVHGKEALNSIIAEHPDLAILDLGMPGLTGIEGAPEGAADSDRMAHSRCFAAQPRPIGDEGEAAHRCLGPPVHERYRISPALPVAVT